jgi:hypothetical protein
MAPKYIVTYTVTYGNITTSTVSEDGIITTIGSYFGGWKEVKTPYTGQIIENYACYDDFFDDTDEDTDSSVSEYDIQYTVYLALLNEVTNESQTYTGESYNLIYLELYLGRSLTEVELESVTLVWNLYTNLNVLELDNLEYTINYLEYFLNRALTEEELQALLLLDEISLVETLYQDFEFVYDASVYERAYLSITLGRPLTQDEINALDIVSGLESQLSERSNLDALIALYERILDRVLTEEEIRALTYFETGYIHSELE